MLPLDASTQRAVPVLPVLMMLESAISTVPPFTLIVAMVGLCVDRPYTAALSLITSDAPGPIRRAASVVMF